ncbi:hypothetical protein ENUP19_0080G0105 [Entamoeba nuttalli]|uniref:WD domain, G-beta repeat-containing protein n=2 Tax=Entamoeba nuttalli TaxID=412467 RepID=K2GZU2_ENTNP|nr:WD domain, G-beta repeat-containing protein [Entamoeba nuttalli P19]EKE40698.1 WD domain, G-beta repeat-containing protein [Entamoeba nuttalli P19]|eukprot:XP_008856962.1 WD domain, G-beta repeat-containing protein [Entamoeba nuttalli P19]
MVKTYLDYKVDARGGAISTANILYFNSKQILVVRNKTVILLNTRTNTIERKYICDEEISVIAVDDERNHIAAGTVDGKVNIFSCLDGELLVTFSGHRTGVRILEFSENGEMVLSVANEPEIVVWDIVREEGVCRFRGHLNMIQGALFIPGFVVSVGDDGLVKVWDLEIQQCRQTIVGHRAAIKALIELEDNILLTSTIDGKLRVLERVDNEDDILEIKGEGVLAIGGDVEEFTKKGKILGMRVNNGTLGYAEIITSNERLQSKKRKKRLEDGEFLLTDYVTLRHAMKLNTTIKSICVGDDGLMVVAITNGFKEYRYKEWNPAPLQDHYRPDARLVLVSDDDMKVACIGDGNCSMWNPNGTNLGSIDCGRANTATFLPGGRFIAIGTVGGSIEIIDTAASVVIGSMTAHSGEITVIKPWKGGDMIGLVSGGKDKQVRLWMVDVLTDEDGKKCVTLTKENEWEMDDSILNLTVSKQVLAVALMDNTVKVYKLPTMQFYLSLYGHNLPVTALDISDDNNIIITGSADKSIKVWGLQYGECIKTFKGHEDLITGIACIPRTHYFFSVSRDKSLRYWDADKQIQIKTFKEHNAGILSIGCSTFGDYIVSSSADHSFIVWMRSKEQIFVEEEENKQLTQHFNDEELKQLDFVDRNAPDRLDTTEASRKTIETIKDAEDLMAVLDLVTKEDFSMKGYEEELAQWNLNPVGDKPQPPEPNILLCGLSPSDHLLKLVGKISPSNLQQTLLMLPTSNAILLLRWVVDWLEKDKRILMGVTIASFLCKVHYSYFSGSKDASLIEMLEKLANLCKSRIEKLRLTTATNLELLKVVDLELNDKN